MAFGSVATSKVKVILEAQDHVTATLNKLKQSFSRADRELDARLQQRAALHQEMAAWDRQHSPTAYSYQKHLGGVLGYGGYRSTTIEPTNPELMKRYGLYNPFISGAHVVAALSMQTNRLYANAQRFADGLIKINQWMTKASASLMSAGGKLTMSGGIMTGAGVAGLRSLYTPLSGWGDVQMRVLQAQAKSTASAAEYDAMLSAGRSYASRSSWNPQEVSRVMAQLASMGFKPDQIIGSFQQMMDFARAVDQEDPMWAAQGIGALLNSFNIDPSDANKVRSVVDKMTAAIVNSPLREDSLREAMKQSAALGLDKNATIDDLLAWSMVMAQKGIDGSIAGTAQKNFMTRLGKGKITDYLASLGVDVYNDDGSRKSARQVLTDISALKKDPRMTDKKWDELSDRVFGMRSVSGINAIFDDNSLERAYSALADAEGLSEQIREHMESGAFGSIKRIQSALQDMFLEIGKSLENVLKELEPKLIGWFEWLKQQIEDTPSFVQRLEKVFELMVQIGIPVTAIGISITAIGAVLNGIQIIASALIFTVSKVLYPVVMGLAKFIVGIFTTMGAIGATVFAVIAAFVAITAYTFRWGKILQAMFNGGSILHGIKLMGWSLWESLKWASSHFFRYFLLWTAKLAGILWKIVVLPIYGVMKAASYIPGLGAVGKAADTMLNAPGQMAESGINWFFDELDKENERTRKEYFKDLDKYSKEARAERTGKSKDIEKRGSPVAMPIARNDKEYLAEWERRDIQADKDWERYVRPKDPYLIPPSDVEKREKIIKRYRDAEEREIAAKEKAAEEDQKRREKEEKQRAKERKAAADKAQAEEKRRQAEEQKAKEFKANQLKRQAELTKGMKPLFQGTVEAAKWLHGLGEYSKDGKTDRELAQEQVDHLASIDETLKNGEVVFQGV